MKNKYFNIIGRSADLYIYGTIVDEKTIDVFTGEKSEVDVDTNQFRNELEELDNEGITDINIYINSCGGSVFASSTMVSLLQREQEKGVKIHSYIDGLCASASTYLCMVADDINIYKNSIMMIHKPMSYAMGNANDLQKEINTLDNIENNMMLPMYMNKAKVSEDEMKEMVDNETWFSGNEEDEMYIGNYFNVNVQDEGKQVVACTSSILKNYKHTPINLVDEVETNEGEEETIKEAEEKLEKVVEQVIEEITTPVEEVKVETEPIKEEPTEPIDYSNYENIIKSLKK